jgi:ATP-dependent RNA helicase DDX41
MSEPEPAVIRRRGQRSPPPQYRLDDDDNYEPYIPVAQRRQAKLARLSAWGSSAGRDRVEAREVQEVQEDEEQEEERRRERVRRGRALLVEAQEVHSKKASEGMWLLHLIRVLRCKSADAKKTEAEKAEEADAQILAAIASRKKLASDRELAKGIEYTETLRTSCVAFLPTLCSLYAEFLRWVPPRYIRARGEEANQRIRENYHIIVDGEDIPPPIDSFEVCILYTFQAEAHSPNRT